MNRIHCLALLAAMLLPVAATAATQEDCLRVAVPEDYATPPVVGSAGLPCMRLARGNHYQLLEWLDNGDVHGAVLSRFAASVLRDGMGERAFAEHFTVVGDELPGVDLERSRISLHSVQRNAPVDVNVLYEELKRDADAYASMSRGRVVIDSHLSPALPWLLDQVAAALEQDPAPAGAGPDATWLALLDRLRFKVGTPGPLANAAYRLELRALDDAADCDARDVSCDVVVMRNSAATLLGLTKLRQDTLDKDFRVFKAWVGEGGADAPALSRSLVEFLDRNFSPRTTGYGMRRHFYFTVDELWSVMKQGSRGSSGNDVTLVLTGGGVKAAYQTRLLDHLYSERYLSNSIDDNAPNSLQVDSVIGTSGGALLGIFVAALPERASYSLTDVLWKIDGDYISHYRIFPVVDMLRYLSVIVSFFVMILVLFFLRRWKGEALGLTREQLVTPPDGRSRYFAFCIPWLALLIIAAVWLLFMAGHQDLEHVPAITGFFYMIYASIGIYSDQRLRIIDRPFSLNLRLPWELYTLVVVSLVAIIASTATGTVIADEMLKHDGISPQILGGSGGFLGLCIALHFFFRQQAWVQPVERRGILQGISIFVLVGLASLIATWLVSQFSNVSFFEFTGSYWLAIMACAAVISFLLALHALQWGSGQFAKWNAEGIRFLVSEHPARTIWLNARRYSRIFLFTMVTWLGWNLLAAPGLYGNANATEYFTTAFAQFTQAYPETKGNGRIRLRVPYVATATSLDKGTERYFLFTENEMSDALSDGERYLSVITDSRWQLIGGNFDNDGISDIAFASGSPFPVFAAHRVQRFWDTAEAAGEASEWLVDGGYAHNIPIEPARALGAKRVLVLSSSPVSYRKDADGCRMFGVERGKLGCNLGRLVPYFYERSQIEDVLSSRNMLVAVIAPTGQVDGEDDAEWPLLTDFRGPVIERMVRAADSDRSRRIALVQNWGVPVFETGTQ